MIGQSDVSLAQSVHVVAGEQYSNFVVDVEPFRVVIHLIGDQRDSGHESKRLIEILELELFHDRIASALVQFPLLVQQRLQIGFALFLAQFGHLSLFARRLLWATAALVRLAAALID